MQVARKNFRLLTEGEALDGYSTLRVARIIRTVTGLFQLDPRFVPPLLDFNASDYLVAIARRIVEILSARSSSIAAMRRQKNQTLADFTVADIANFWLLYTINTAFPTFRHLFETRGGHPEALYAAMLSLAGALTTFSTNIHPREFAPYDHDELGACFSELDEKLRLLLETVVPSNFVSLPLKLTQPFIYATAIDNDKYLQNTKMYIAIRGGKQPGGDCRQNAAIGEGLLRQPHRASGEERAARRAAYLCGGAARRHPRQAQLSVLQHQPIGRGVGGDSARAQSGGLRPERSSPSPAGIDYPVASGGIMVVAANWASRRDVHTARYLRVLMALAPSARVTLYT